MPAYQWLIYPWVDCRMISESSQRCTEGMILTRATMTYFIDLYLPEGTSRESAVVSPILEEDLSGLPPCYVATVGFDPLEDEGRDYAERLQASGVEVKVDHFADVMHGFVGLTGACPSAHKYTVRMLEQLSKLQLP